MGTFIADCPRCGAKAYTHDARSFNQTINSDGWVVEGEMFSTCRNCGRASLRIVSYNPDSRAISVDQFAQIVASAGAMPHSYSYDDIVPLRAGSSIVCPDHVPEAVVAVFKEAADCLSIGAFNAASAMLRLAVDLTTRPLLPEQAAEEGGPNRRARENLHARLEWLFQHDKLPQPLHQLADAVREDGNDGLHQGTLTKADAEDLADFTVELLRQLYTQPKRIELATERRAQRRAGEEPGS